jgi:hypothetical protein
MTDFQPAHYIHPRETTNFWDFENKKKNFGKKVWKIIAFGAVTKVLNDRLNDNNVCAAECAATCMEELVATLAPRLNLDILRSIHVDRWEYFSKNVPTISKI